MNKPRIFIASSVEGKDVADALEIALQYDAACTAWHAAFPLTTNTIDTLLQCCAENDFAIFVFSPDDQNTIRKDTLEVARDNVLFEAGLFMGMHGKDRAFIVMPMPTNDSVFHIPTDLVGITIAKYDHVRAKTEASGALGAAAALIRQALKTSTFAKRRLTVEARANPPALPPVTYPLKMTFTLTNNESTPVAVEAKGFSCPANLAIAPNAGTRPGERYAYRFFMGTDKSGKDIYAGHCMLKPGHNITSWIPFDPAIGAATLADSISKRATGTLHYRVTWLAAIPTARDIDESF